MFTRLLPPPKESILLLGPRGTGKSTWIRSHFPKARSYDLLKASESLRLARAPELLGKELADAKAGEWIVIDEIQKVPALMDEVHHLIESRKLKFVLSGSSARKLKRGGANLLAGRARLQEMFPLVSAEVGFKFDLEKILSHGWLPTAFTGDDASAYLSTYAETYLHEEIKAEALTRSLGGFARFLEIAARQNGQVTNVSGIARDAGAARQTVEGYFSILNDTLLGSWLPAWKLKRATKQVAHPKFYFFDTGVCRSLSGRLPYKASPEESGALFETFIVNELRAYMSYSKLRYPLHFWRSPDGVEVDILLEGKDGFHAIEIKHSARWERKYSQGLNRIADELGKKKVQRWGVFTGPRSLESEGTTVLPVKDFLRRLWGGDLLD